MMNKNHENEEILKEKRMMMMGLGWPPSIRLGPQVSFILYLVVKPQNKNENVQKWRRVCHGSQRTSKTPTCLNCVEHKKRRYSLWKTKNTLTK